MSTKQLFDFIGRADTPEKLDVAERWFSERKQTFARTDFDCFIRAINEKRKRLYITKLIQVGRMIVNPESGEVFE